MRKILALALALCAPWPLAAQNAITQEGTVLQNSPMMFRGNNRARQGATVDGAPTGQTVTTGDSVVGGRCDYSAPTDDPAGYYRMCLDAKTGTIKLDGTKLPQLGTIKIDINGQIFDVPSSVAIVGSDAAVANNATLKLATGASGQRLVRLGFNAPGDGGFATYNWSGTNCANADDGGQVQPTGTGCWVADFSATQPTPLVWGASKAGIESSAAVQKAVDYLCRVSKGGVLRLPAGSYRFAEINVTCALHLAGDGEGGEWTISPETALGADGATVVNCTSMSAYCIRWTPAVYPNRYRLAGGSVEDVRFVNSGGSGVVLDFRQVGGGYVHNVTSENAPNFIRINAGQGFHIANIRPRGTIGNSVEVTGDMTGFDSAGSACSNPGDCSTRSDLIWINQMYGHQTYRSGTAVWLHDMAYTTVGTNIAMEGGDYGLRVSCSAGKPSGAYCPQQINFADFETEFSVHPYYLTDFTVWRCDRCYGAGESATTTENVVYAAELNYPQASGAIGGVFISNSQFFAAANSCVYLGVSDTSLTANSIAHCNGSAGEFAGIQYALRDNHLSQGNFLCHANGASNTNQWGLRVDAAASNVSTTGDAYHFCVKGNVKNDSSLGYSVERTGENPPPAFGTISAVSGCGTGCTAVGSNGNEYGGQVLITAGAGATAFGQFTMSLKEPLYPGPICLVQPQQGGTGNWNTDATFNAAGFSTNSVNVYWRNGAAALTPGSSYFVNFKCAGF